ncbi:MAG TPA: peptide ABC transporter substrate-binding protein [Kofleriaceae bacterium]|nr:peptide ABC transporter substrate-binding protein [Kofleriaceae bacterium]
MRLGGIALACVAAAGCGLPDSDYFGPVPEVRDPRHLRWCNSGQPEGLDPAQISSTTATPVAHALFDGLTIYGNDGHPEPSLATHWDIAPDLRRFTFHLRSNARWSNGRPVTAYDVAYQVVRVLHPLTASPSADGLDFLKGYDAYIENRGRVLLRDAGGLPAGTIVTLTAAGGRTLDELKQAKQTPPETNRRAATRALALRDLAAPVAAAYATVPPRTEVTIIELTGRPASLPSPDGQTWAYVHWNRGDGVFGWVPLAELDLEPNADVVYRVRPVPDRQVPGLDRPWSELRDERADEPGRAEVEVRGRDLLALPEILGVRVPDEHTVVLETATPTPHVIATTPSRVLRPTPREAVSRSPRRWAEPGTIVTSGPMHLVAAKERDYIELVRSPTYWNPADVKLDRLTILSMDDQAAIANTYYTGGCDAIRGTSVPTSYLPVLTGDKRGGRPYQDFQIRPWLGSYFILINTQKYDNVHLRRALALSLDRRLISKVLHGGEIGSASYVPGAPIAELSDADLAACGVTRDTPGLAQVLEPGKLCYVPPRGLEFDPERARAELALARQEMGARFPKVVTYKFNTGVEGHKLIAEYVQAQWKQVLGIDVSIESQEWQVFLSDTRRMQYETARLGWIASAADPEGQFLRMFRCNSPNNRPKWCDPRYEALMDEAAVMTDRQARLRKLREAEEILLEASPIIPLYAYTQKHLQKPYVRDLYINFIDQPPLWRAWLDPDWKAHAR